jgi:hypothetical protein
MPRKLQNILHASEQVMPLSSDVDERVNAIPEEGRSGSHRDLFFTVLIMGLTWTLHMIQKARRQYSDRLTPRIFGTLGVAAT